ncbi:MAG: 5-methyltetrahydropteroyltriglutamate--homocysteine S-methyltransferase [Spirochaetia bacterium]
MRPKIHTIGFPRIGRRRELKRAVESYWKGETNEAKLLEESFLIAEDNWTVEERAGLDFFPSGDFSLYDQVLDTAFLLGIVPPRFHAILDKSTIETYFAMARGSTEFQEAYAMEMTKWFNTNYHYIVPEFSSSMNFTDSWEMPFQLFARAKRKLPELCPSLIGPLTLYFCGKFTDKALSLSQFISSVLPAYKKVIERYTDLGAEGIQMDEPVFAMDVNQEYFTQGRKAYSEFSEITDVLLAIYFTDGSEYPRELSTFPVSALHVDLSEDITSLNTIHEHWPKDKPLSAGILNGRNVWKADLIRLYEAILPVLNERKENLWLSPSCPMQFVPYSTSLEDAIPEQARPLLAFAEEKLTELKLLSNAFEDDNTFTLLDTYTKVFLQARDNPGFRNENVRANVLSLKDKKLNRVSPFQKRKKLQQKEIRLPLFPTTTIGSFPQTREIRRARSHFRKEKLTQSEYQSFLQEKTREAVEWQVKTGLDVLVHGEFERNDMVEYFGEQMEGFLFTKNGWVQSYGTRCVKPPIIYKDISRTAPMTVSMTEFAASVTEKPVKGMLTGPVTITKWSFAREDLPVKETAFQLALALAEEIQDLEKAGIRIIQVDEPAFREALPLKKAEQKEYLRWAVRAFKAATHKARSTTQIHSHMCYSEFNEILEWIADFDADVISIEASRSKMELLEAFSQEKYPNDIGPGVYDIHSPRVPSKNEILELLKKAVTVIPKDRLWVNPDCGLKTRKWEEVVPALENMVAAAKELRKLYMD